MLKRLSALGRVRLERFLLYTEKCLLVIIMTIVSIPIIAIFLLQTAPVCNFELYFLDLDTNTSKHGTEVVSDSLVLFTFNTEQLAMNHLYKVTVNASNAAGSTLSPPITISKESEFLFELIIEVLSMHVIGTHDIVNITATGNEEEFIVSTTYFEHSNATGALFNFAYLNDKGDLSFTLLPLSRRDSTEHNISNFSIFESLVRISVYDIESDGVLFSADDVHYPAVSMEKTGTEQCMITIFNPECEVCIQFKALRALGLDIYIIYTRDLSYRCDIKVHSDQH